MTKMIPPPLSVGLTSTTLRDVQWKIFAALFECHVLQLFRCPISGRRRLDFCKNAKPVQSACLELFNSDIECRWDVIAVQIITFQWKRRIHEESTAQIQPVWVFEKAVVRDLGRRIDVIYSDRAAFEHFDQTTNGLGALLSRFR